MASTAMGSVAALLLVAVFVSWMGAAAAQPAPAPAFDPLEGNPVTISWYRAHGWLMWLAFGIFFPLGVLVSRYGQYYFSQWFWAHISLQVTGVILSTISFALSVNKFQVTFDSTHTKLGVAIMCLIWLQPLLSFVRPRTGSSIRPVWYFVHWLFGTTAIVLGWFNIFKGLDLYVQDWPTSGTLKASYVLWAVNVAILGFLYLFLERLPYIRSQSKDPMDPIRKDATPYHKTSAPSIEAGQV